jgi:microcompartment protein CcmK/EutM
MPVDLTTVEWVMVAMAVAAWLQVLLFSGMVVGAFTAWKRTQQLADEQLAVLHTRIDEVAREVKTAARAVDRVAERTGTLVLDTGNAVRTVATAVARPQTVLLAGAVKLAGRALKRWRRGEAQPHIKGTASLEERHVSSR